MGDECDYRHALLWVEVSRASEQFAEVVEWSDEWEMYYPASTSEYYETVFEVIDLEAGCIAARGTTGARLVNAVGDGFLCRIRGLGHGRGLQIGG